MLFRSPYGDLFGVSRVEKEQHFPSLAQVGQSCFASVPSPTLILFRSSNSRVETSVSQAEQQTQSLSELEVSDLLGVSRVEKEQHFPSTQIEQSGFAF